MIKSQKFNKAKKQGTEWLKAVFYALLITWIIRLLVLQGFFIPSASMEQTLLTGDFLFINKLAYGPRIPITPLSLPFVHQHLPFTESTPSYFDWIQLPYLRIPGYSSIKQNDIVVFNYPLESEFPIDKRTYFIKRCIGLPNDTIEIANQKVKVNGELLAWPEKAQKLYYLKSDSSLSTDLLDSLGITEGGLVSNTNDYNFPLTDKQVDFFHQYAQVKYVRPVVTPDKEWKEYLHPHHPKFKFNEHYYGPVWIPAKGFALALNDSIIWLYKSCIERHEGAKVDVVGTQVYINGEPADSYTFKQNYYWVLGDNRDFSNDSRTWGFVPENHIVGRASFVLFSTDALKPWHKKIRWNRIFHFVN